MWSIPHCLMVSGKEETWEAVVEGKEVGTGVGVKVNY